MKILIVAVHFEVTGARYITDAFKRLGHDARHTGALASLKDAWCVDVPKKYIWTPEDYYVPDWSPDLIILADTIIHRDSLSGLYLEDLKHVPIICWSQDNHVRNVRNERNRGVTHYFLAHKHGQAQPVTHTDETWLPCAADTTAFPPSPIAWEDRKYDVAMVGVMYPHRLEVIEALKAAGLKVYASTGDVYDEYRAIYQNARISLCLSANDDLAQRVFETGAMGCLIAMDIPADVRDEETARALGITGYIQLNSAAQAVAQLTEMLTTETALAKFGAESWQKVVLARHDWTHRAQVVVDWYNANYGKADKVTEKPTGKPYLNLGCGKTHLPSEPPLGHDLIAQYNGAMYDYPQWVNIDKIEGVGADKVFDIFSYPWPLEDNSYDGALCAHILEHIPHEINSNHDFWTDHNLQQNESGKKYDYKGQAKPPLERWTELAAMQDGWYAFFSELYRVLTPGAFVHCLMPYGFSHGAITDPTHTRYLTADTFSHSMQPSKDGATFQYNNGGINFEIDDMPAYEVNELTKTMEGRMGFDMMRLLMLFNNMAFNFYIRLKVIK